jgi:hypothetical protein
MRGHPQLDRLPETRNVKALRENGVDERIPAVQNAAEDISGESWTPDLQSERSAGAGLQNDVDEIDCSEDGYGESAVSTISPTLCGEIAGKKTTSLQNEEIASSLEEALPLDVQVEILNRVADARGLASCMATSRSMKQAVKSVQSLNLICRKRDYEITRALNPVKPPSPYSDDEDDMDSDESDEEEEHSDSDSDEEDDECCGGSASGAGPSRESSSSSISQDHVPFKNACLQMLKHADKVEKLRLEIEPEMQANPFQKDEIHLVDFWLSEPAFARKWVDLCSRTLQHLSLVDYGQQAIMRQSPILRILSEKCTSLKTLELRNMYVDTCDLKPLPHVTTLTLRCIKLTEHSLTEISESMPSLESMALVSVFGVQEARIHSSSMRVVCLGLSTKARVVDLNLPNVHKLQLKMTCPDVLRVCAPNLAYVAVCMEKRDGAIVEFERVTQLKELLFGASQFWTLRELIKNNCALEKVFLDVPCMALGEDGKWEGVLHHVPLQLPDVRALQDSCPSLHTLSVGPGLWHSMEEDFKQNHLSRVSEWPALSRLIVHMIVQSLDTCLSLLRCLTAALPSLQTLEIYVHSDSPVEPGQFLSGCREQIRHTVFKSGEWKKSLCFACFSF